MHRLRAVIKLMRTIRSSLVLGCLVGMPMAMPASAMDIFTPKAVVEMFTSQGCSSCPPADEWVVKTAPGTEILPLAWHVDYWDYLGWKDTFAMPGNADRQRRYSVTFGENQIYTPQAVINGRSHTVGSRRSDIESRVKTYVHNHQGMVVKIHAKQRAGKLEISIPKTSLAQNANLWMVYYNEKQIVDVKRGENRGRKLAYSNIVRDVELLGMVEADGLKLILPISELSRPGITSCAMILQKKTQKGTPGPIIGAVAMRNVGM